MNINKVYCLFEQSGTFKNIFLKKGVNAIDIDIENQFNETNIIIDLLSEIKNISKSNLFNNINSNDLIIAFFPCTYFSNNNDLYFRKQSITFKNMSNEQIDKYIEDRLQKRDFYLRMLKKLMCYSKVTHIPLIVENPRSTFLRDNLGAGNICHNRNIYGDKYKKPTYYYTINCTINENKMIKYPIFNTIKNMRNTSYGIKRSLIEPRYAENLINAIEIIK